MDADTLRDRHRTAVARYAPLIADTGRVPYGLLDELARIGEEHADERVRLALDVIKAAEPPAPEPGPVAEMFAPKPPAARTAARRTRTRTTQR